MKKLIIFLVCLSSNAFAGHVGATIFQMQTNLCKKLNVTSVMQGGAIVYGLPLNLLVDHDPSGIKVPSDWKIKHMVLRPTPKNRYRPGVAEPLAMTPYLVDDHSNTDFSWIDSADFTASAVVVEQYHFYRFDLQINNLPDSKELTLLALSEYLTAYARPGEFAGWFGCTDLLKLFDRQKTQ